MYVEQNLDGFNPLKAIGRALGSTGRAIAGAVATAYGGPAAGMAVTGVLGAAAKMPSGAKAPTPTGVQPVVTDPTAAQPAAAPVPTASANVAPSGGNDLMQAALLKFITTQPQMAPVAAPSAPSVVISSPSAQAPAAPAAASPLPPWAIPAMIGAGLLILMQSKK